MDLSNFDKDQIVMATLLGRRIDITAGLVGCSSYQVVGTYQMWFKIGQLVNK